MRSIVSQIDVAAGQELPDARHDLNNRDFAAAVAFTRLGDYALVAVQGSNAVDVLDAYDSHFVTTFAVGNAPQGIALSGDGNRIYVQNFLSRDVTVGDVRTLADVTALSITPVATVRTVAEEPLPAAVLRGKQIFYNADDRRMNRDGYISCASCHQDGESDGRVWDFSDRGEGFRNTIDIIGRAGLKQGRLHWTGNFDEVQDFEGDIRKSFGGTGFLSDSLWEEGMLRDPLGAPKRGLSPELDALAAFVRSLTTFGESPYREAGGRMTAAGQAGRVQFLRLGCHTCHEGAQFTDSPSGLIHDVGTIKATSGQRLGKPLKGLDTPTLKGLWRSAPYLHDGSAPTLMDVLTTANKSGRHGRTSLLQPRERDALVAYLLQIDDLEGAPGLPDLGRASTCR